MNDSITAAHMERIEELESELAKAKNTIWAFENVHIPLLKNEIDILKGEHHTWSSAGTDEPAGGEG